MKKTIIQILLISGVILLIYFCFLIYPLLLHKQQTLRNTELINDSIKAYYIAPWGNDTNPGTLDLPYKTLGKALSKLSKGDTLYVGPGRYNSVK